MQLRSPIFTLIAAAALGLGVAATPAAAQQTGMLSGSVQDATTARSLEAARVNILALNMGTLTNQQGRFQLANVPAGTHELRVEYLGYETVTEEVVVRPGETTTVSIDLTHVRIALSEIVVTGTAARTMQSKLPFDVATLSVQDLPVPSTTAAGLLQGKVAGVTVTSGTGRPGSAPSILLRGATSINASGRSQDPLYIVDGVIMGSSMVDIGALDVKNIEVVKGAAAASLYGSRAANGVIQITTKDGGELPEGTVSYTARTEFGQSNLNGEFNLPRHHQYRVNEEGAIVNADGSTCIEFTQCSSPQLAGNAVWRGDGESASDWNTVMSNPWPGTTYNQVDRFFTGGDFMENYLAVSGRSGDTNFHTSYNRTASEGVIIGQVGFERHAVRLNVDQQLRSDVQVSANAFYSRSTQEPEFTGGALFDLTRMRTGVNLVACESDRTKDCLDNPDDLALLVDPTNDESPNPLYELLVREIEETRGRFLGSADINFQPTEWLSLDGNVSYDRLDREQNNLFPKGYRTLRGSSVNEGFLSKFDETREALNANITAGLTFDLTHNIRNTTRLRYLYESQDNHWNSSSGFNFAVAEVPTLGNLQENFSISSSSQPVLSDGYFAITNFDISDRYVIDALVRNDGSSLFGENERRHTYYRLAGAWRLAQEDWFDFDGIDELKLRSSFGTAGGRPNWSAQYETYSVSGGRVRPVNLGNRQLKPEFSREFEAGVDAIVANRFIVNATYARTTTEDQILPVPLPSFSGFGTQWQNAGTLESTSWEAGLEARLVDNPGFSWTARVLYDRTNSTITELSVPPFQGGVGGGGGNLGNVFYYREGEQIGTFYGNHIAQSCADLPTDMSCDGFTVDQNGWLVWVGDGSLADNAWGTASDVQVRGATVDWGTPFLGECTDRVSGERATFCPVGNSMPDYQLSFASTLNWMGLSLYGLLHGERGFDVYNQPAQWATFRDNYGMFDQADVAPEQQKPVGYWKNGYYFNVGGLSPSNAFVEDGSYWKIREISATYRLTADQMRSIPGLNSMRSLALTLTGRNLFTWTDYQGYDPEVGTGGGTTGSASLARVEGYQYPNFRTFTFGVELIF